VALELGTTAQADNSAPTLDRSRTIEITGEIGAPTILQASNKLMALSRESTSPVYLLLNSPGGSVIAGLQFLNAMEVAQARGVDIRCIVPGMAMSMAFQILLQCDRRYALRYSLLLWHPLRTSTRELITPELAENLSKDLHRIENDLYPLIVTVLSSYGMDERDIRYHYLQETTWTANSLGLYAPGFIEIVNDIDGIVSPWYGDMLESGEILPWDTLRYQTDTHRHGRR